MFLFEHIVESILLYNCGTWALTLTGEVRLNAYHRKQLKKIIDIRDPKKITNKSLYRIGQISHCQYKSYRIAGVSLVIFYEETKKFFLNKATRAYFIPDGNKLRGRPKTSLLTVFNRHLVLIQHTITLHSSKDPADVTEIAQDRKSWRGFASQTKEATEVSQTKNWDATWQYLHLHFTMLGFFQHTSTYLFGPKYRGEKLILERGHKM